MKSLLAYAAITLVPFGTLLLGYQVGTITADHKWETGLSNAQALCADGIVARHQGDFYCFTESKGTVQWRPRWNKAFVVSEH